MEYKIRKGLTLFGVVCIVSMFTKWFGVGLGMSEKYGAIVLMNPLTLISLGCLFAGIWMNSYQKSLFFSLIGSFMLIVMEFYYFMTWHHMFITGVFSLKTSIGLAYPMFYIGVGLAILYFFTLMYFQINTFKKLRYKP